MILKDRRRIDVGKRYINTKKENYGLGIGSHSEGGEVRGRCCFWEPNQKYSVDAISKCLRMVWAEKGGADSTEGRKAVEGYQNGVIGAPWICTPKDSLCTIRPRLFFIPVALLSGLGAWNKNQ